MAIGIGGMQSFDEEIRSWGKNISGGDKACLGGTIGSVGSKEWADYGVTWVWDAISQESGPVLFEVGKRDWLVNFSRAHVMLDGEVEAPLWREVDVTFVECTIMVHGDFGVLT